MIGSSRGTKRNGAYYRCLHNSHIDQKHICPKEHYISENIVAKALIPFLVELFDQQLESMLHQAADQYGKTITEDKLEEAIKANLVKVKERKNRVVQSIAEGVLSTDEVKEALEELRSEIYRLTRELATLGEKEAIRQDFLKAMEILKGMEVEQFLWRIIKEPSTTFRRILEMIFQPVSIVIVAYGTSRARYGTIETYKFNERFVGAVMCADGQTDCPPAQNSAANWRD